MCGEKAVCLVWFCAEKFDTSLKRAHQPRDLRVRTLVAMTKPGSSRPRPLTLRSLSGLVHALAETRSLAQEPACKDLGRNGQRAAITPKDAYTPAPNRASLRSTKKHSQTHWQYFRVELIHLMALIPLRLFLVYIMYYSTKLALEQGEC